MTMHTTGGSSQLFRGRAEQPWHTVYLHSKSRQRKHIAFEKTCAAVHAQARAALCLAYSTSLCFREIEGLWNIAAARYAASPVDLQLSLGPWKTIWSDMPSEPGQVCQILHADALTSFPVSCPAGSLKSTFKELANVSNSKYMLSQWLVCYLQVEYSAFRLVTL